MSDTSKDGDKPGDSDSAKDIELNEAFARLEKQVEKNKAEVHSEDRPVYQASSKPAARQTPKATASSAGGGFTGGLALLLALVALGLASFSAYTLWQQQQNADEPDKAQVALAHEVEQVRAQLGRLSTDNSAGREVKAEVEALLARQVESNQQLESRLTARLSELKNQLGTTSQDWLMAEAEYLLRLANQRVAMEDDVSGAIALFQAADKIIREVEGVVAFDLRQAIANDIAALKAVSNMDIEGTFVQLGSLASQIPKLQQKRLAFVQAPVPEVTTPLEMTLGQRLMAILERFGSHLSNLVDYRADGEVVTPILPPDEEYYLQQNLLLKIQLAQLGLLRGNQEIYSQSLVDARAWVDRYFDQDSAVTKSIAATLDQLLLVNVARDLPDVSTSLREIRKLMARFHQAEERQL